jgi:predicted dehydrogenase
MSKLNWVVIGVGDITRKRVIPALKAEGRSQLYGIVTRDPAKAAPYTQRVWGSLHDALSDTAVDAIYVASPVFLHATQTIESVKAGKHVVCEKPMAMNEGEARSMVRAAEESEKVLGVAYYRRTYPKVQQAKKMIAEGAIGQPVVAELTSHGWFDGQGPRSWLVDPGKSGGGPLYDIASHRIDLLNFFFGEPQRATGHLSNAVHHYSVEDNATVMIDYEGGVRGLVDVRWHSKIERDECCIRGTEGEINLNPLNGPELICHTAKSGERKDHLPTHQNLHFPMIENFVASVLDGAPLLASGASSVWTDWVTERAKRNSVGTA